LSRPHNLDKLSLLARALQQVVRGSSPVPGRSLINTRHHGDQNHTFEARTTIRVQSSESISGHLRTQKGIFRVDNQQTTSAKGAMHMFWYLLLLVALLPFATVNATFDRVGCAVWIEKLEECERCCERLGYNSDDGIPYVVLENAWKALYPYTKRECICIRPAKAQPGEVQRLNEAVEAYNQNN
jgi:hypothetical protein